MSISMAGTPVIFGTYTPVVTLVGGSGNTVPQYITNDGFYNIVGNICFFEVDLSGDGGNEGAGTGQVTITLPFTASASQPSGGNLPLGTYVNSTSNGMVVGAIAPSATTVGLQGFATLTTTTNIQGSFQSNTTRRIRLSGKFRI